MSCNICGTHLIAGNTFDVCTSGEEASFTRNDGEDCVWVFVEGAERGNGRRNEGAAERVEGFGAVELRCPYQYDSI
jgi:hypothetical protein